MRGADEQTGALFSYLSPEAMVPKDHPLRAIRPLVNAALARLSPDFSRLYAATGRGLSQSFSAHDLLGSGAPPIGETAA